MTATVARDRLYLPTLGKEIPRPWFVPDAETLAEQERILAGTYFLVRTQGVGDALRCDPNKGGCGGRHPYLTLRCVEQPFSGITRGIYAYFHVVADNGLVEQLGPADRARYDAALGVLAGMPALGTSNPSLARALTRDLGPRDAVIGAIALGILEPIPPTLARSYRDRINRRGIRPRFSLPGMED